MRISPPGSHDLIPFMSRVAGPQSWFSCWEWRGYIDKRTKYGKWANTTAHRVAYILAFGSIPNGLVLDHLCRVRHCVNPLHLEPVTQIENQLRGPNTFINIESAKTHCAKGHEYNTKNTYVDKENKRHCRVCDKLRKRAQRG